MSIINLITDPVFWLTQPWLLVLFGFQIWMLVDAVKRQEWIWAVFIFFGSGLGAMFYYFSVFRPSRGPSSGFELPGAGTRARIKELEAKIHHLDKAHHHFELGDVYFRKGNFKKAEGCYRASLEREPNDIDARSHLGQALLRTKRAEEARPLLKQVCDVNPKHDYGYTLMAYAETLTALGETDLAICAWKQVLDNHAYARARVQLAELLINRGEKEAARVELNEVVIDDPHSPKFQRKRDRIWVRRAKSLMRKAK